MNSQKTAAAAAGRRRNMMGYLTAPSRAPVPGRTRLAADSTRSAASPLDGRAAPGMMRAQGGASMLKSALPAFAALAIAATAAPQSPPAAQTFTLASSLIRSYQNVQRNVLEAAEKMPEASYSFRPTAEIRPFGELIAHTALAQFGNCAALKGIDTPPHKDDKEDAPRTKTELIALFKESTEYCDPVIT